MTRRRRNDLGWWIKHIYHCVVNYFICLRYPFLKIDTPVYPWLHGYGQTWLDHIEYGWRKCFGWRLVRELDKYLKDHNITDYHIDQVKEKWGRLEWYDNYFDEHGTYDLYNDVIKKYSVLSEQICVICGKHATHKSTGWILPYCDDCHDKGDECHYSVNYKGKKNG